MNHPQLFFDVFFHGIICEYQRVSGAKASLAEAAEKAAEKRWETRDRGETTAIGCRGLLVFTVVYRW